MTSIDRGTRQALHEALCGHIRSTPEQVEHRNAAVDRVVRALQSRTFPHAVARIHRGGSTAKGTAVQHSDVDMVVELGGFAARSIRDWMPRVLADIENFVRRTFSARIGDTDYVLMDPVRGVTPYAVRCNIPVGRGGAVVPMDILPTCTEGIADPNQLPVSYRSVALTPKLILMFRRLDEMQRDHCKAVAQLLKAAIATLEKPPISTIFELVAVGLASEREFPNQWELLESVVTALADPQSLHITWGQRTRHPSPVVLLPSTHVDMNVFASAHWTNSATSLMKECLRDWHTLVCAVSPEDEHEISEMGHAAHTGAGGMSTAGKVAFAGAAFLAGALAYNAYTAPASKRERK